MASSDGILVGFGVDSVFVDVTARWPVAKAKVGIVARAMARRCNDCIMIFTLKYHEN